MSFTDVAAASMDSEGSLEGLGSHQDDLLSMHSTSSSAPPANSASISDPTTPSFLGHLVVTSTSSLGGDGAVATSAVSAVSESTPVEVAGDPHAPGVERETGAGSAADMAVNSGTEAGTPSSLQGGVVLPPLPQASGDSQDTPGPSFTISQQQQQQQQRPVVPQVLPLPSLPSLPLPVPVGTVPPLSAPFFAPASSAPSGPSSIVGNIGRYTLPPAGPLAQHPQLPPPPPHMLIPLSTTNLTSGAQPGSQASDIVGGIHDDAPQTIQSTPGHHLYYASLPPIVSPSPPAVPVVVVGGVDGSNGNNIDHSSTSAPAGLLPLPMSSLPAAENFRLQPGTSGTSDLGSNPEEQATVAAMELVSSLPDQTDLHGQPGSAGSPGEIECPETPPYVPEVQMKGNEPWTPEEDERLKVAVQRHSLRNWKKIARHVPGRTAVQCLQHYKHVLHPGIERGSWTPEEDKEVLRLVSTHGLKWAAIAEQMPRRLGKRIRERYVNHLDPSLKQTAWTAEEELALIQKYQEIGQKWSKIAKFLPGRSVNSVKNHWSAMSRGRGVLDMEARRQAGLGVGSISASISGGRGNGSCSISNGGVGVSVSGSGSNGGNSSSISNSTSTSDGINNNHSNRQANSSSSGNSEGTNASNTLPHDGLATGGLNGLVWPTLNDTSSNSVLVGGQTAGGDITGDLGGEDGGSASPEVSGHATDAHGTGVGGNQMSEQERLVQGQDPRAPGEEAMVVEGRQSPAIGRKVDETSGDRVPTVAAASVATDTSAPEPDPGLVPAGDPGVMAKQVSIEDVASPMSSPAVTMPRVGQHRHEHASDAHPQQEVHEQMQQGHGDVNGQDHGVVGGFAHHEHTGVRTVTVPPAEAIFSTSPPDLAMASQGVSLSPPITSQAITTPSPGLGAGIGVISVGTVDHHHHPHHHHPHQMPQSPDSSKNPSVAAQRWTDEQSLRLRELVEQTGPKDWTNISKQVVHPTTQGNSQPPEHLALVQTRYNYSRARFKIPPKTYLQCMLHWNHVINPELTKGKGSWKPEEDKRIIELVQQCGHKWSVIAAKLKMENGKQSRVGKQIRERYLHHLDPNLKKGPWTQEEENILIREHGIHKNKWAQIARALPGRCDNDIKNHWYAHQRRTREMSMALARNISRVSDFLSNGMEVAGEGAQDDRHGAMIPPVSAEAQPSHLPSPPPPKRARIDEIRSKEGEVGNGSGQNVEIPPVSARLVHHSVDPGGGHIGGNVSQVGDVEGHTNHFAAGLNSVDGHVVASGDNGDSLSERSNARVTGGDLVEGDYQYHELSTGDTSQDVQSGGPTSDGDPGPNGNVNSGGAVGDDRVAVAQNNSVVASNSGVKAGGIHDSTTVSLNNAEGGVVDVTCITSATLVEDRGNGERS